MCINQTTSNKSDVNLLEIRNTNEIPPWAGFDGIVDFFNLNLRPYEDSVDDVRKGLEYAFSDAEGKGGFLLLAVRGERIQGGLLMLNTGMEGYVPEHLLLFVGVRPETRGEGIGKRLIERALALTRGDVKLHVEYSNPAKRLYERLGFTTKYAEMRYTRGKGCRDE